jgi:hypothetical protein
VDPGFLLEEIRRSSDLRSVIAEPPKLRFEGPRIAFCFVMRHRTERDSEVRAWALQVRQIKIHSGKPCAICSGPGLKGSMTFI